MKRYRATYSFVNLPPLELCVFANNHATRLTGHAVFTDPIYTPVQIETAATALFEAVEAWELNHGDDEYDAMVLAENELSGKLKANADYVSSKAQGDKILIESVGFVPTKDKTSSVKPTYSVSYGSGSGKMLLYCKKEKGDKSIVWLCFKGKVAPEDFSGYSFLTSVTTADIEIGGLDINNYYCFIAGRVKSKNNGVVEWLDPIIKVVP